MNRKGNITDNAVAIIWFFMIAIVLFIMVTVTDNFGDTIKENPITNISQVTSTYDTQTSRNKRAFDYGTLFLAILLPIFSFVAARKIPSDTIFMVMTFFVLVFIILFAMIFANIYGAMLDNSTFASFSNGLIFIPFIMKNLLYYSLIYTFVVVIGLFTKTEAGA